MKISTVQSWLGSKSVRYVLLVLVVLLVLLMIANKKQAPEVAADAKLPVVTLTTAEEFAGEQTLSVIGAVRAFSEAKITSEKSGRVTSVPVSLGQYVKAGTVLATLENASEQAAVLQAEGVYDAAVAAAAQSGVGVDEAATALQNAQNGAVSTFKSAYNTTNGIVRNSIDTFFSDPDSFVPGLRIDGKGFTADLNRERVSYQTLLPDWQARTNTISTNSDLVGELLYARENVQRTIVFVDTFIEVFDAQKANQRYSETEITTYRADFTNLRATLIGTQSSIDGALTGLESAADGVRRAELAATGGTNSAADAQVKQALGALRAAQANLAKSILRAPVSGTVNSLSVRTGDFVGSFSEIAVVASNDALEVVTYVSDTERELIAIGDTVLIDGQYEGIVTNIAPAVDSVTRKTEVRIATENTDIKNGDTVRVSKTFNGEVKKIAEIRVPITAVKFELEDGFVYVLDAENKLVAKPVQIGTVLGGSVAITEGLSASDQFVTDARGLIVGEEVTFID